MRDQSLLRSSLAAAAILSLTLAACGGDNSNASTGTSSTTTGTGGSGGSGDGGLPCPAGSHAGTSGACEADLTGWTSGPKLKHARDHHVTFAADTAAGSYLYVVAGMGSLAPPLQIERAAIAADGTLGPFEDLATKLTTGLIGPGMAQIGQLFVLGGGLTSDSNSTASTYIGKVTDDGEIVLGEGPDMNSSRYHVSLAYAKGHVFALGGLYQQVTGSNVTQDVLDVVERASFDGTTLSPWETIAPLPVKLTHHATVVYNDAIYVIGGGSGQAASADIYRATVSDQGDLGAWELVGQLSEGRASPAATVFLDKLYVVSGMTSLTGGEVATVLAGSFDASGKLGAFTELSPLPKARAHSHQAPFYNGYLYSAGGSINHAPQSDVFLGKLQ
ncbi:MAG: hypothetical protein QM820_08825 [Minicystis sp.]